MHETAGSVEDAPPECLGLRVAPDAWQAEELEPPHEVCGQDDDHEPGGVVLEAREGKAGEPRVLQAADVLFDMRVRPHGDVEISRVAVLVGVEAPVAVVERGEEAALGAGVEWLTPDDEPGSFGQLAILDRTWIAGSTTSLRLARTVGNSDPRPLSRC